MAFQSIVGARLIQVGVTTAYVSIYTAPVGSRVYVKDIDICNTTGSPITVYLHLVPVGDAVSTANALFYNMSIPAYGTLQWTGSQIMNAGDTLRVKASGAGCAVTITGGIAT
jgi:hypothetical protein